MKGSININTLEIIAPLQVSAGHDEGTGNSKGNNFNIVVENYFDAESGRHLSSENLIEIWLNKDEFYCRLVEAEIKRIHYSS